MDEPFLGLLTTHLKTSASSFFLLVKIILIYGKMCVNKELGEL